MSDASAPTETRVVPTSQLPELLRLSLNSGGSGHGMSYWTQAAACGLKAIFDDEKRAAWAVEPSSIPTFDRSKLNAFAVGGVYHKLHELWRLGKLSGTWFDFAEPLEDASVALGIRLFREWHAHWPRDFWGKQLAVELNLPRSDAARETLTSMFGEVVNAQPDLAVYISEDDLPRVRERCPVLTRPGNYLIDFKTAGGKYDDLYYTGGTQALWYPMAWEIEFPDLPLEGIIFDIIQKPRANAKVQTVTREMFHAVYASSALGQSDTLVGLIEQGRANIDRARSKAVGNRAECIKFSFTGVQACPFLGRQCAGGVAPFLHTGEPT